MADTQIAASVANPRFTASAPPNERGKTESVIDVMSDKKIANLRFDSETGMPQYDPISREVLVNLQDKDTIAEIDPATGSQPVITLRTARRITEWS